MALEERTLTTQKAAAPAVPILLVALCGCAVGAVATSGGERLSHVATGIAMCVIGLAAGIATLWSPCGFAMVGSIVPIASDEARERRPPTCVVCYLVGSVVGGVGLAAALLLFSSVLFSIWPHGGKALVSIVIVGIGQGALVLREADLIRFAMPQATWQVPREWRIKLRRWRVCGQYGLLLGSGLATRISSSAYYAFLAWSLVLPWETVLSGALAYSVGRTVPVLLLRGRVSDVRPWSYWWHRIEVSSVLCRRLSALVLAGSSGVVLGVVARL